MGGQRQTRVVLASRSPQRRAILEQIGIAFEVVESGIDEVETGPPAEIAVENARRKALAVAERIADDTAVVIGCDTVVAIGEDSLGKPVDAVQAREFITRLAGRGHEVHGGLALVGPAGRLRVTHAVTRVRFRAATPDEIDAYVATGEWRDRSGGYAIQQRGAALVESTDGDILNVVGLPVDELRRIAPELSAGR